MPFKTTVNWQFNDICYLVIGCFDWKIGVFQKNSTKKFIVSLTDWLCFFSLSVCPCFLSFRRCFNVCNYPWQFSSICLLISRDFTMNSSSPSWSCDVLSLHSLEAVKKRSFTKICLKRILLEYTFRLLFHMACAVFNTS